MGKKSLVKSTETKKKATAKKGAAEKAPAKKAASKASAKAEEKKTPSKKAAPKKAAPKKAAAKAPAKKAAAKAPAKKAAPKKAAPKAPAKKAAPKKVAAKKPVVPVSELLAKKFDWRKPQPQPAPKAVSLGEFSAPSYEELFGDQASQVKSLLNKQFDLSAPVEKKEEPAPAPVLDATAATIPDDAPSAPQWEPSYEDTLKELDPSPLRRTLQAVDSTFDLMEKGLFVFLGVLNEFLYGVKRAVRKPSSPTPRPGLMLASVGGVLLLVLLLMTSWGNAGNFYFKSTDDGYQMYRGRFAPAGAKVIEDFPGLQFANPPKDVYSIQEAYEIANVRFMARANYALYDLEVPDYEMARKNLLKAEYYTLNLADRKIIQERLNRLDFDRLITQADMALSNGALSSIQTAKKLIEDAAQVADNPAQEKLVDGERQRILKALEALKVK